MTRARERGNYSNRVDIWDPIYNFQYGQRTCAGLHEVDLEFAQDDLEVINYLKKIVIAYNTQRERANVHVHSQGQDPDIDHIKVMGTSTIANCGCTSPVVPEVSTKHYLLAIRSTQSNQYCIELVYLWDSRLECSIEPHLSILKMIEENINRLGFILVDKILVHINVLTPLESVRSIHSFTEILRRQLNRMSLDAVLNEDSKVLKLIALLQKDLMCFYYLLFFLI